MNSSRQQLVVEDQSVVSRMQKKFWKTKQVLIKVTGKKEDEHVVASDAELDAKLEIFHSIQATGSELIKMIDKYQQALNALSQEENDFGLILKVHAQQNSTQAGKMMKATGNALCSSAGQRLAICTPLSRLEQEMATFSGRAVSDTLLTINRMETARTEYRGALLWMKDVSQELDPDTYKQMEKFRKVQIQVRNTKSQFDKTKMDVCQKVDLLGASRCNLLSHSLASYQTTLLHFWKKTAHLMSEIQQEFQAVLPYGVSQIKPCKQHSESSGTEDTYSACAAEDEQMLVKLQEETAAESGAEIAANDLLLDCTEGEDFDKEFSFLNLQSVIPPELALDNQDIFGGTIASTSSQETGQWTKAAENLSGFLPSHLLDLGLQSVGDLSSWTLPGFPSSDSEASGQCCTTKNTADVQEPHQRSRKRDMSAWLNMFADLDPLANLAAARQADDELISA
ncbi:islet cell autoantigen 1-like protein [Pelodytes ibericus]